MRHSLWIAAALCYSPILIAFPTVVPDPIPCVFILETEFFNEAIVNQGLSLYNVRQELWLLINERLRQKNQEVPERMKIRTAYRVPNPIEYPMNRLATAKILKGVLLEVFLEVMREYRYTDRIESGKIFDYIFSERLPDFVKCFGREAKNL